MRAVRLRRGWRQIDVAVRAGVSDSLVSLIERGHAGTLSLDSLRGVAAVLDIRIDLVPRWRGGELDRLLNSRHAALTEAVARWLRSAGWEVLPEVTFSVYGERGVIDLLGWHAATRTLLVVEVKTEIVDVQELIGVLDRKTRLAPIVSRDRDWFPANVATLLVVADSATNRRRVSAHSTLLHSAYPVDGRSVRAWLRRPVGRIAGPRFLRRFQPSSARARSWCPKAGSTSLIERELSMADIKSGA